MAAMAHWVYDIPSVKEYIRLEKTIWKLDMRISKLCLKACDALSPFSSMLGKPESADIWINTILEMSRLAISFGHG